MSDPDLVDRDRHCAGCLKFLPDGTAKMCGKCYRRAYCSKECQVADWKQGIGSQGHKNWCDLNCGEEDMDWEVRPVPGKGLGIVAKRPIPSKSRIMIDAVRRHDHPAIKDLMPIGGTLEEKFLFNSFEFDQTSGKILCLRISRINHDCDPNATSFYCKEVETSIVVADRDIQPGEEITINYLNNVSFSDVYLKEKTKMILSAKWGIICKPGCVCFNDDYWKALKDCADLDRDFKKLMLIGYVDGAMQAIRKLIGNFDAVRASWQQRISVLYSAYQVGVIKKATLNEAMEYLRRANEIHNEIYHPNDLINQEMISELNAPWLNKNYLILEKK